MLTQLPSTGDLVAAEKTELRRSMRRNRDAIAPEAADRAARAVADRLRALPTLAGARIVAVYAAAGSELDTAPAAAALRALGITLAYPRVLRGDRRLAFHRVDDAAALRLGAFRIPEPEASAPLVPPHHIDAFLVPGLAFDPLGRRLGWGHGYYDTALAACPRAQRIGLAFECQIVSEVPNGERDAAMDHVITEARERTCGRGKGAPPTR